VCNYSDMNMGIRRGFGECKSAQNEGKVKGDPQRSEIENVGREKGSTMVRVELSGGKGRTWGGGVTNT